MPSSFRIISIGTLASHPLWHEAPEVRTGHATTTLVSADDGAHILVDPSLPPAALLARLGERTNLKPDRITHVFLTSADPLHRRGLAPFAEATWLAHPAELEAAARSLHAQIDEAAGGGDKQLAAYLRQDLDNLRRCRPAPDKLAGGVDLFPLPGATPGCCGLLLPLPGSTVLICGDAIPTIEHLEEGKVLPGCADIEQARESFGEAVQIADILILGRDNVVVNPLRRPF